MPKYKRTFASERSETQEELRTRFKEINILQGLIRELEGSLEIEAVLQKLVSALQRAFPTAVNFAYTIPAADNRKPRDILYLYARTKIGRKYLDAIRANPPLTLDQVTQKMWLQEKFIAKFIEGKRDNAYKGTPKSILTFPLMVSGETISVISISSPEPDRFQEEDVFLLSTIIDTATNTIARLRRLLESEQSRMQVLVNSLSNGVVMFNLGRQITVANPVAKRISGHTLNGKPLEEFTAVFENAPIDKKVDSTLTRGKEEKIEEAKIGKSIYEMFITPARDYGKNVIGGAIILHDITRMKEIDRMKTEFVSVASHQLRTPLAAIKLFGGMLMNPKVGPLNKLQKEYMENIQESVEQMIVLVDDLLNVSRLEAGRLAVVPKQTNMAAMIKSIIKESTPAANEKNCALIFKKPQGASKVRLDPVLIRQVIHNLVSNAIKYSNKPHAKVTITLEKKSKVYKVSVQDKGIGITRKEQLRIFERFFRGEEAMKIQGRGTGLGLYVAKMILEAGGGKIWFESKGRNKGTTFYVTMPREGTKTRKKNASSPAK
jgi:PAS domain S-box-containing protein